MVKPSLFIHEPNEKVKRMKSCGTFELAMCCIALNFRRNDFNKCLLLF
jgi:hypothetical protein